MFIFHILIVPGELYGAMSHISKPVDWEVFNIPSVQPVQYYSILKKKREFSQLIKQYDSQVFNHGYLHYCGIVPRNINSSFNNICEIVIVFFDEIPNTSFIGFKVTASKETFTYESNLLLLFLKKTNKKIFYLMNNNCIHVQCGTNAWELFYLLYDNYLRRYVLTIIGTQFFYHFVYSHCIQRERQLLEILYKGSKVIRISKNSIYYKIHGKRKISVTDLIYMTVNMPKSKKFILSSFSSKESLLYSNINQHNLFTSAGSKINVSKLELKKFKNTLSVDSMKNSFDEIPAFMNPMFCSHSEPEVAKLKQHKSKEQLTSRSSLKRKFEEFKNGFDKKPGPSTLKICKTSEINSSANEICKDKWEQYTNLKPATIKHYSNISCISHLVPNLLSNGHSFDLVNSNSSVMNTDWNVSTLQLIKMNEGNKSNNISRTEGTSKENGKTTDAINENESGLKFKRSFNLHADSVTSRNSFSKEQKSDRNHSCLDVNKNSTSPSKDTKNNEVDHSFVKDVSFTTAAGNSIEIPDTAMLTAHKFIQDAISDRNQEALNVRDSYNPNKKSKKTCTFKDDFPNLRKTVTKYSQTSANKHICDMKTFKDKSLTKKFETVLSPKIDENFRLDSFDTLEDVGFSTAAGKTIKVSNSAIQAAKSLIQGVFSEENKTISSRGNNVDKNAIFKIGNSSKEHVGCSKKLIDESIDADMDNTIVEKFFENTVFDEKELELATEHSKNEDLGFVSKSENFPAQKPRKSLGGRRSMRYCSSKL